jgi:hypothetical protein
MSGPARREADQRGFARAATSALRPSRRGVVQALACWSLPVIGFPRVPPVAAADAAIPPALLIEIFGDTAALRLLGLLYLRDHAREADPQRLRHALFNGSMPQTAAQMAQSVAARRAHDLAAGDIAIVGGWLMTRGEAQLCALVALTAAPT